MDSKNVENSTSDSTPNNLKQTIKRQKNTTSRLT